MIIDEKGKLFGKINIIDFLVLLVFLGLTPMVYYGYKILNQPPPPPPPPPPVPVISYLDVPLSVFCLFKNIDSAMVDKIKRGDKETNRDGTVIAEIEEVVEKKADFLYLDMGRGVQIHKSLPRKQQVLLKLKLLPEKKKDVLYHKEIRIALDALLTFNTKDYEIKGKISPPPAPKEKTVHITVSFDNLLNNVARVIKEMDRQNDSNGQIIGEIEKIVSMEGATTTYFLSKIGEFKKIPYPDRKDAEISFRIHTLPRRDGLYYKGTKILIGTGFTFQTDLYQISGTIIDVKKG